MSPTNRPTRADARRNFDALVAAASETFDAYGISASLDDIAAKAGVGNATLYRHFPTRESLILATLEGRLTTLDEQAHSLRGSADPGAALDEWFFRMASELRTWAGLPESIQSALEDPASALSAAALRLQELTRSLLEAAQKASAVRADLTVDDVCALASSLAWASGNGSRGEERLRRLVNVVYSGMRR